MKVFKVTANILYLGGHFPIDFTCEPFGEGDALEWNKSLDLMLAKYNNIKLLEGEKGDIVECFLFAANLPKKVYNIYRDECEREGYSEIAEGVINYDWDILLSKKIKL